jgi:hypothetical protein
MLIIKIARPHITGGFNECERLAHRWSRRFARGCISIAIVTGATSAIEVTRAITETATRASIARAYKRKYDITHERRCVDTAARFVMTQGRNAEKVATLHTNVRQVSREGLLENAADKTDPSSFKHFSKNTRSVNSTCHSPVPCDEIESIYNKRKKNQHSKCNLTNKQTKNYRIRRFVDDFRDEFVHSLFVYRWCTFYHGNEGLIEHARRTAFPMGLRISAYRARWSTIISAIPKPAVTAISTITIPKIYINQ